jgi:hypothetical protein
MSTSVGPESATENVGMSHYNWLSEEIEREFRRPFTVEAVRFKPQSVSKDKTRALATFYIDARLAAERLNAAAGAANWADEYRVLFESSPTAHSDNFFPVECRLTVYQVTKTDVGIYQKATADDKAVKSAYSDAFKRAAVKFGIGAYLYAIPGIWAPVEVGENGKVKGFTKAGIAQLKRDYLTKLKAIEGRFGTALDHGDVGDDPEVGDQTEYAPPRVATIPYSQQKTVWARARDVGLVMIDKPTDVDKDKLETIVEMVTGHRKVSEIAVTDFNHVLKVLDAYKERPADAEAKILDFIRTKENTAAETAL